jgi:hypothetical protein
MSVLNENYYNLDFLKSEFSEVDTIPSHLIFKLGFVFSLIVLTVFAGIFKNYVLFYRTILLIAFSFIINLVEYAIIYFNNDIEYLHIFIVYLYSVIVANYLWDTFMYKSENYDSENNTDSDSISDSSSDSSSETESVTESVTSIDSNEELENDDTNTKQIDEKCVDELRVLLNNLDDRSFRRVIRTINKFL